MPRCLLRPLLVLLAALVLADASAGTTVRVLLAVAPKVVVVADGPHAGTFDGTSTFTADAGLRWPVAERGGRLLVDGHPVGKIFELTGRGAPLSFGGHRYRGSLRLIATQRGIDVVNVLDVEQYLKGVVPAEMSPSWPMAALEAQAVAARSYAISSLNPGASYDLCATVDCQVYRGMDVESARSDQAVRATRGVVVMYDGHVARTYYHADSGGETASSREVWGTALPYLVQLPDAVGPTPFAHWEVRVDPRTVAETLAGLGEDVGSVRGLRVLKRSGSGRVDLLEVDGSRGVATVTGAELENVAQRWGLKSTRFSVAGLTVYGEGWGHGVGMSQYGARALAEQHYDYTQILAYYYPHTRLVRWVYRTASSR